MTGNTSNTPLVPDEDFHLTLSELCRVCQISAEQGLDLVDEGIIEPVVPEPGLWRFQVLSIRRVRCACRLTQDLGLNSAGAALAVELLEEIEQLRARLRRLERLDI